MPRYLLASALSLTLLVVAHAQSGDLGDLTAKLASKETAVRRQAATDLSERGPEASSAAPALRKAMRDADAYVRRFSAQALGKIGPDAADVKATVSTLALAMNDTQPEVQLAAADALAWIGPPALDALLSALKDPTKVPAVRKRAAQGLGRIGPAARGAVPALSELVTAKAKMKTKAKDLTDDDIRIDAAAALGKVAKKEDKVAIDALKEVSEGKQRNKALLKAAQGSLREIAGTPAPKKR
ncbi:MAG: HEAT repeat domain-containing protein [Gemmataceae bacterium]